uniref:Uncharacterized protein n=1 Tax=Strongyloides venezuelensis TaxID=75913 RepID=A0A0K0FGR2_STRVS
MLTSGNPTGREIKWLFDGPSLTVKYKRGLRRAYEMPILERINITKDKRFCEELEEENLYYWEKFIYKKEAHFKIKLDIEKYIPKEHVLLVKKIAEDGVKTLLFEIKCKREQCSFLVECQTYMNHENVKHIELPRNILKNCQCLRNPNVWTRDILDGFPKLNEVDFYIPDERDSYYGSFGNRTIIKYIIKTKNAFLSNLEKNSLRKCGKLKKVELRYISDFVMSSGNTLNVLSEENLVLIAALMPDTVERLKISRGFNLLTRITDNLNEFMPSIKILTFYDGNFLDSDHLSAFKNLKIFTTDGNHIIEIPKTIKLLSSTKIIFILVIKVRMLTKN